MEEELIRHTCSLLCVANKHLTLKSSEDCLKICKNFFCLYSMLSAECLTFIHFPLFSSVSPSRSLSVFAHVCPRPPGVFRANTDQKFGPVPYPPPACVHLNANLLLMKMKRLRSFCVLCVMNEALSPISALQ